MVDFPIEMLGPHAMSGASLFTGNNRSFAIYKWSASGNRGTQSQEAGEPSENLLSSMYARSSKYIPELHFHRMIPIIDESLGLLLNHYTTSHSMLCPNRVFYRHHKANVPIVVNEVSCTECQKSGKRYSKRSQSHASGIKPSSRPSSWFQTPI